MLQQQLTKKQKRANRLTSALINTHNNHGDLPLIARTAVEWLVQPDNTKILNPNSRLGSLLYADPSVLQSLRNFTRRNSCGLEWESILLKVRSEMDDSTFSNHPETYRRYELVTQLIRTLSENNATISDARDIRDTIANHRRYVRRYNNTESVSLQTKVQRFKNDWTTMRPDRVQDKFLPHGEAIGVELEWLAPCYIDEDANYQRDTIDFERPNNIYGTSWGYDSSITDFDEHQYNRGQETRVMLRYGKWNRLIQTCAYIKEHGGEVNKTCGVHVHLDTRHLSRAATITRGKRLGSAVTWLRLLVPKSRARRQYCQGAFSTSQKYQAVTMHNYGIGRKCIEVRLHSGSLNATKIINWIELLHFVKNNYIHLGTWEEFLQSDCPLHLKMWAINRKEKFNPTIEVEPDIESEQIEELPEPLPELPPVPSSISCDEEVPQL